MKKKFSMLMVLAVLALVMAAMPSFAQDAGAEAVASASDGGLLAWLSRNMGAVFGIVTATLGVLAMVCKLTPSPRDDAIVAKILGWLNMLPVKRQ